MTLITLPQFLIKRLAYNKSLKEFKSLYYFDVVYMALLTLLGIGIVVVIVLAIIAIYNGFIAKRNRVQDALRR